MPGDEDGSLEEKRIYGDERGVTVAYVASELGVTSVEVSGDRIGRFGLAHRCTARDVAGRDGQLLVATDEDVLVGTADGFESTDFGPAGAVGFHDGFVAADDSGRVARFDDESWNPLGTVADVRAIHGDLLAAADGVYQMTDDSLRYIGLDDARDVAAADARTDGLPLAATADGLYYLGNGWMDAVAGAFEVVSSKGTRAHAATADALYERVGTDHASFDGGQDWRPCALPTDDVVVDLAYGDSPVAVTREGTFLVDAAADDTADGTGGWRSRSLGLTEAVGVAVP